MRTFSPPVYLAKIDATINTQTLSKYKINTYPTFKFFVNGSESVAF